MVKSLASFSMECGLLLDKKTNLSTPHAGGLGILEGDNFLTAQDLDQPYVEVSLLHNNGYVKQDIDQNGMQVNLDENFVPSKMQRREETVTVKIDDVDREVYCYEYNPEGSVAQTLLYLSTDGVDNHLYRGDKLAKSIVLGIGGIRILQKLGYDLHNFHFKFNESNTSLALVELLRLFENEQGVRDTSVYFTHTRLNHGHDVHDFEYVKKRLRDDHVMKILSTDNFPKFLNDGALDMSHLAYRLCGKTFAVSKQQQELIKRDFPDSSVDYLTNGVHWSHISDRKQKIFDKYLGEFWRIKPELLRYANKIPAEEFQAVHDLDKRDLINFVKEETGVELSADRPLSGWVRRQTGYKKPLYLFSDIKRLKSLSAKYTMQHIQAGKSHPEDKYGLNAIEDYHRLMKTYSDNNLRLAFVKNYNLGNHKIILNGLDFLLYTPAEEDEACGTSYMKAMWAGVPVLGSLAGGFPEICVDGVNSFSFRNTDEFYNKLESMLIEYDKNKLAEMRRNAISVGTYVSSVRSFNEFLSKTKILYQEASPVTV